MSTFEILQQIIDRSGLDRNQRHPLYSYRVTQAELVLLQTELSTIFNDQDNPRLKWPEDFGAFCLFGAEWFRRNYQSGPWTWDVIFDGLNLNGSLRPKPLATAEYVKRGLNYWKVRLHSTHQMNLYLRTVVCQGGFPVNILSRDGAGLSRMLKAALRDHEHFPTTPLEEILSRYIHFVPLTLQTEEMRRLVTDLVTTVAILRKRSNDAQQNGLTRVAFLDQNKPGWEVDLPLRVEEPKELEILLSLIDAVKSEPLNIHHLSISTSLLCNDENAFIVRDLRCPHELPTAIFMKVCNLNETSLFPKMTGYLQAGDRRIPAISISRSNDGSSFRLTQFPAKTLNGSQSSLKTSFIIAVGGEEIGRVFLPGGEALPDSPWIFKSDESHRLIGVGGATLRDESVWIAVPQNYQMKQSDMCEFVPLTKSVEGRGLFKLIGKIDILCDGEIYRISTNSNVNSDCLFELRGNKKRLGIGGSEVWCGRPFVWRIPLNEDEVPSIVQDTQTQWKPVLGGVWSNDFRNCLGHIQIRAIQENNTLYMTRAIVMPATFGLEVIPSRADQRSGELKMLGLGTDCNLHVEVNERIQTDIKRSNGSVIINVKVLEERPELIRVRITFPNGNKCEVSLVCPTRAFSILNVLGQTVDYPNGIPNEKLDGLTIQLIQTNNRIPLIYWPKGSLLVDRMRETNIPGVFEFPLSYIANYATELLACTDDPDGEVTFGIGTNVALFNPDFEFSIGRYLYALDRKHFVARESGDEGKIKIYVNKGNATIDDCKLNIVPLGNPNELMPADSVESVKIGKWVVDHSSYPPGYYLAVADDPQGNKYRPLRFAVGTPDGDSVTPRPSFWPVMNISQKPARLEAWDNYFTEIAKDHAHPDWNHMKDFVLSETLPVTTFEALAAITRNHFAAARYGIHYPDREILWRRFEQLPFLWSAIPIHVWLATAAGYWKYIERKLLENGMNEDDCNDILEEKRVRFLKETPKRSTHMFNVVIGMWASKSFRIDPNDIEFFPFGRVPIDRRTREHTRLIRHHARFDTRSTWPNFRINCQNEEKRLLRTAGLMIGDNHANQWAVLNGPGIAAVRAVYGNGLQAEDVHEYKRLRALDPEWYDIANAVAMYVLLKHRCYNDETYLKNTGDLNP